MPNRPLNNRIRTGIIESRPLGLANLLENTGTDDSVRMTPARMVRYFDEASELEATDSPRSTRNENERQYNYNELREKISNLLVGIETSLKSANDTSTKKDLEKVIAVTFKVIDEIREKYRI